jgi:hypothetical protein
VTTMTKTKPVPAADPGVLDPELAAFWAVLPRHSDEALHELWMSGSEEQRRLVDLDRVRREIEADGLTEQELRAAHTQLACADPRAQRDGTALAALQYIVRREYTAEQRMRTAREARALMHAYSERVVHGGTRPAPDRVADGTKK